MAIAHIARNCTGRRDVYLCKQWMIFSDVAHHIINHRDGQSLIRDGGKRLHWRIGLESLNNALVVFGLGARQLAETARGKDSRVIGSDGLLILCGNVLSNGELQCSKTLLDLLRVLGCKCSGELLRGIARNVI